jgi:hypothetical protein
MVGMIIAGCGPLRVAYLLRGERMEEEIEKWAGSSLSLKQGPPQKDVRYDASWPLTPPASSTEDMYGRAVALYDFEQENDNELPLVEGQIILVLYRHGQGWLAAQNLKTQQSGLVPEEYVQLLQNIHEGPLSLIGSAGEQLPTPLTGGHIDDLPLYPTVDSDTTRDVDTESQTTDEDLHSLIEQQSPQKGTSKLDTGGQYPYENEISPRIKSWFDEPMTAGTWAKEMLQAHNNKLEDSKVAYHRIKANFCALIDELGVESGASDETRRRLKAQATKLNVEHHQARVELEAQYLKLDIEYHQAKEELGTQSVKYHWARKNFNALNGKLDTFKEYKKEHDKLMEKFDKLKDYEEELDNLKKRFHWMDDAIEEEAEGKSASEIAKMKHHFWSSTSESTPDLHPPLGKYQLEMQHPPQDNSLPSNPTDQIPCNTLYVKNLPIDTSEDELKAIFSIQSGYKRLLFRTKYNSPICMVEFEDVACATKALNELDGHSLQNSANGGIQLSFSKTPLGVRASKEITPLRTSNVVVAASDLFPSLTALSDLETSRIASTTPTNADASSQQEDQASHPELGISPSIARLGTS